MKRFFFVGLALVFSVFLLCAVSSNAETANTASEEKDASNIGIKSQYKIANTEWDIAIWHGFLGEFAYSPDGRFLLYTQRISKKGEQIVIVNLATRKIEKVFKAEYNDNPAWSPDGHRIFACGGNGFSIYEIKSGKNTVVKDTHVPCGYKYTSVWHKDDKILFLEKAKGEVIDEQLRKNIVLDLNLLSYSKIPEEEARQVVQEFIPHSLGKADFRLDSGELKITNNDGSFSKVLVDGIEEYAISPKYDSFAFGRRSAGGLYLAYFDTNFKTEMNYSVESFSDSLSDDLKSAYTSFMSRNELLTGQVFAPKINPLTGKVVGTEGEAKGTVKIIGESNGKVVVQKIFERTPFKVGVDVLSDIKAPEHIYYTTNNKKVRFELKIWPTLQKISDKELEAIKEDKQKQVANVATEAKDWVEKGNKLREGDDQQGAIDAYSKAIELDPNNINAYENRGRAYGKSGNYKQAVADFSRVIDLNPKSAIAYEMRGFTYDRILGYKQKAIQDLKTAASLGSEKAQDYLRSKKIQRIQWK